MALALLLELGLPALLLIALWRIWPRETADRPGPQSPDHTTSHHES